MRQPKEYISKTVSAHNGETLDTATTKLCNEMLKEGYVFITSIAHIQQLSATLLFAKY